MSRTGSPLARVEQRRILTQRADALLAEARQMGIPYEEVLELLEKREARLAQDALKEG